MACCAKCQPPGLPVGLFLQQSGYELAILGTTIPTEPRPIAGYEIFRRGQKVGSIYFVDQYRGTFEGSWLMRPAGPSSTREINDLLSDVSQEFHEFYGITINYSQPST